MNRKSLFAIAIPAVSLMLCIPTFAQEGSTGMQETMRMVPARAALRFALNADKVAAGSTFEARLADKTQLANGPLLPAGTRLVGTVVRDDANSNGASTLALRFETAYLKDGMTVPIKATIIGAYAPQETNDSGWAITPGEQVSNAWNDGTLRVDQIGVMNGIDLHSAIASPNSGVFISETHRNVKLEAGSELALAIAARSDAGDTAPTAGER